MVEPVERDSRGIIDPAAGLERFRLTRHAPSPGLDRFVDRVWVVTWDLGAERHSQDVLAHPVVNVIVEADGATVHGVADRRTTKVLEGAGRAVGVMFRPGGFRPFLGKAVATIAGRTLPLADVLGPDAATAARAVADAPSEEEAVAVAEGVFAALVPDERQRCEDVTAIVEQVAADRSLRRVDQVAARAGCSTRTLQRLFAEHVGATPKAVIRRYRLYDAAEQAARGRRVSWAQLAVDLGYSDQAHLAREFTRMVGTPPARYARRQPAVGP